MFIGEYTNKIDDKGRLAVPVKFRSELASGAVITRGLDGCLFVYTLSEWRKLTDSLTNLSLTAANARALNRHMLAGAMEVTLDKQGRVILPGSLRKSAGIATQVVVAGVMNRLEIWDETKWREYLEKTEAESTQIAEQIVF